MLTDSYEPHDGVPENTEPAEFAWSAQPGETTGVLLVDLSLPQRTGSRVYIMFRSDAHHDSPHCNRRMELEHLRWAERHRALIVDLGDCLDVMQGRDDPRRSEGGRRAEHAAPYFDSVIDEAADFYRPFVARGQWLAWLKGNHETAVEKRLQFSPTGRLLTAISAGLEDRTADRGHFLGYRAWIKFRISCGTNRFQRTFYLHHGSGGGGAVTRGVIQTNRTAASVEGADYNISGHVHEHWYLRAPQAYIDGNGKEKHREVRHLCVGGYKQEHAEVMDGYHIEKGRPPKPLGAWVVCLAYDRMQGIRDSVIELA